MRRKFNLIGSGIVSILILIPGSCVYAQCKPGDILVGEDEKYYYCSSPGDGIPVKSEQNKLDQNYDIWVSNRQKEVFDVVQGNMTWKGAVMSAIKSIDAPSPITLKSSKDLQPGDILLIAPGDIIGEGIVLGDALYRVVNDLSEGKVFKAVTTEKAPVSHAITYVKDVKGTALFLDHIPKEGSRVKNKAWVEQQYENRKVYVARPETRIDGKKLWEAAREAALKKKSDFGFFGKDAVCSERATLAVTKASGLSLEGHRLGPVDITPGDFFDKDRVGKYFVVVPLERW